jgi:hypothetical protein
LKSVDGATWPIGMDTRSDFCRDTSIFAYAICEEAGTPLMGITGFSTAVTDCFPAQPARATAASNKHNDSQRKLKLRNIFPSFSTGNMFIYAPCCYSFLVRLFHHLKHLTWVVPKKFPVAPKKIKVFA